VCVASYVPTPTYMPLLNPSFTFWMVTTTTTVQACMQLQLWVNGMFSAFRLPEVIGNILFLLWLQNYIRWEILLGNINVGIVSICIILHSHWYICTLHLHGLYHDQLQLASKISFYFPTSFPLANEPRKLNLNLSTSSKCWSINLWHMLDNNQSMIREVMKWRCLSQNL
jgi:hypothetical protein